MIINLDRAIPTKQGDGVAVLIGQELYLQMVGVLSQHHNENGGAGYFGLYLEISGGSGVRGWGGCVREGSECREGSRL